MLNRFLNRNIDIRKDAWWIILALLLIGFYGYCVQRGRQQRVSSADYYTQEAYQQGYLEGFKNGSNSKAPQGNSHGR